MRRISAMVCQMFFFINVRFLGLDIFQRGQSYKFFLERTSIGG